MAEVAGKVAVVTGGASGIGAALAVALANAGAAGVVVADLDGEGAGKLAAQIEAAGHRALAVTADLAREVDARDLVARAEAEFGPVDLFFSNAGIIVGGGVEVPDEAWARIWAVNVQSHVYVTRAVLPSMLARGDGYLIFTASAAGLLTQLGSAPYSVTKHALVALAEWLSITHGEQGIKVSALCPQAVATNLGATSRAQVSAGAAPAAGQRVVGRRGRGAVTRAGRRGGPRRRGGRAVPDPAAPGGRDLRAAARDRPGALAERHAPPAGPAQWRGSR